LFAARAEHVPPFAGVGSTRQLGGIHLAGIGAGNGIGRIAATCQVVPFRTHVWVRMNGVLVADCPGDPIE
jgi:hypothetical protein